MNLKHISYGMQPSYLCPTLYLSILFLATKSPHSEQIPSVYSLYSSEKRTAWLWRLAHTQLYIPYFKNKETKSK